MKVTSAMMTKKEITAWTDKLFPLHAGSDVTWYEIPGTPGRRRFYLQYTRCLWNATQQIFDDETVLRRFGVFPDLPAPNLREIDRWKRKRHAENAADLRWVIAQPTEHTPPSRALLFQRLAV